MILSETDNTGTRQSRPPGQLKLHIEGKFCLD